MNHNLEIPSKWCTLFNEYWFTCLRINLSTSLLYLCPSLATHCRWLVVVWIDLQGNSLCTLARVTLSFIPSTAYCSLSMCDYCASLVGCQPHAHPPSYLHLLRWITVVGELLSHYGMRIDGPSSSSSSSSRSSGAAFLSCQLSRSLYTFLYWIKAAQMANCSCWFCSTWTLYSIPHLHSAWGWRRRRRRHREIKNE